MSKRITSATINFCSNPIPDSIDDLRLFDADVFFNACKDDVMFAYTANTIFPAIAIFLLWNGVRDAQRLGPRCPLSFRAENLMRMCETTTEVERQIHGALGSVVARCCRMNKSVKLHTEEPFLKTFFKKSAEDNQYIVDENARQLALEIAAAYEAKTGKSIMECYYAIY